MLNDWNAEVRKVQCLKMQCTICTLKAVQKLERRTLHTLSERHVGNAAEVA